MTDVMEIPAAAKAAFIERQQEFDATRPPCPKHWCNGRCTTDLHFGDALLHVQEPVAVESVPDQVNAEPGKVTVHAWRDDCLGEPSTAFVELDVSESGGLAGEYAIFTASQARQLAATLLASADLIDPPAGGAR